MELNERVAIIETDVKHLVGQVDDIKDILSSHVEREQQILAENDRKFAGKWTEKLISSTMVATIIAILGVVAAFITGR